MQERKHSDTQTKIQILVVDDDRVCQIIVKKILSDILALKDKYEIVTANTGEDALRAIIVDGRCFSLVFMDKQMPGKTSVEITKAIREKYTKEDLPIIANSADHEAEDEFLTAGANRFFDKPLGGCKHALEEAVCEICHLDIVS